MTSYPRWCGPQTPRRTSDRSALHARECPTCGSPVETREGEVGHWCPNLDCPALLPEQLKSFVGKRAMEIDGLGEHWCQELVERKLVQNAGDLYLVTRQEWLGLNRMGEKLADRILPEHRGQQVQAPGAGPLRPGHFPAGPGRIGELARNHGSIEEISRLSRGGTGVHGRHWSGDRRQHHAGIPLRQGADHHRENEKRPGST